MSRLFSTEQHKGLIRQNSDVNLDKDSQKQKGMRQMREMNSVNKEFGNRKKQFFFQQGQKVVGDFKFDVRKQIGTGYSSKVYKAISVKNNQNYAIKVIEFKNFKQSHFEMLQNQIKILKKMSHPNILKFQHVSKTPSHLYIVTEYCEKGDLLTYMTRKGVLPQKQALQIFSDILKGVQYLQKMSVIHRDIKPGNILFDGKNWKIADFGFSIQSKQQIRTRNNVGTPLYMPLQSLQKNLYSTQSDIFSAGVVLYELLVGITPWQCRDQQQLIKKLKTIQFRIPQKSKISESIKQLLKRLCQPLKENRMTKKQFISIDPSIFKNFQSSINIFIKQSLQQPKTQISPTILKRKISIKNLSGQLRVLQLKQKNQQARGKNQQLKQRTQQQIKQIKQKNYEKPNNQLNLFANGKMKKSSQNVKEQFSGGARLLRKIRSAQNLFASQLGQNIVNQQSSQGKSNIYFRDKSQKQNRNVLLALLNFCRFMYYLMKNVQYLQLNEINRQKLKIMLMKHAISLLKQLTDNQNNWFALQDYDNYKQTKNYFKMYSSFQEYLTKYEKQYQSMVRKIDASITKQITQKLNFFSQSDQSLSLSSNQVFYKKLLSNIGPILRQNNHNLASQIINNKKKLNDELKCKIEGIKQFLKYYRLLEMLSKQNSSMGYFQQNNNIVVVKNYSQSASTIQEFMNLRKQMKYI